MVPENIHTPPTEGIFHVTPPPLWIFQNQALKYTPSPPEIKFFRTPPGNISISSKKKEIRLFIVYLCLRVFSSKLAYTVTNI